MGRHPAKSKTSIFFTVATKLTLILLLTLGLTSGISAGINYLTTLSYGELYVKTLPYSEVAGKYIEKLNPNVISENTVSGETTHSEKKNEETKKPLESIGLLADSHNFNENLRSALRELSERDVTFAVHLGDYTSVGTLDELNNAKEVMDDSGVIYHSIPGDHDLWKSSGVDNFNEVFGENYRVVESAYGKFVLTDNSDTNDGLDEDQMEWLVDEISKPSDKPVFLLMHNPLYNGNNFKLMGEHDPEVKEQADELLKLVRQSKVRAVISGDNHLSSKSPDPERSSLEHIVIGALTDERNLQTPRFAVLNIFQDGSFEVKDIVLNKD